MFKWIIFCVVFLCGLNNGNAARINIPQQLNKAEYFIDKDPGFGKGNLIQFNGLIDSFNLNVSIPTHSLSIGGHMLYLRTQDSTGMWSAAMIFPFNVIDSNANKIKKLEYLVGKEPGVGKANSLAITASDSINKIFDLNIDSLPKGDNLIYVRGQLEFGLWSPWQLQNFFIEDTVNNVINDLEYFVGKEPGIGKGTKVSIIVADSFEKTFNFNTDTLPKGNNFFYIRSKLRNGFWSPLQLQNFFIEDTVNNTINDLEYFVGKDPGIGKGTKVSISVADSIEKAFDFNTDALPIGNNFFQVRSKLRNGFWSPWQLQNFFIVDTVNNPIKDFEYFVGKDPGIGKGNKLSVKMADTVNNAFVFNTDALPLGHSLVYVRYKTRNGFWSPFVVKPFYIQDTAISNPIKELEYFVGKEPGIGKGNKVSIAMADTVDKSFDFNTDALPLGHNLVYVRYKIKNGFWSPFILKNFFITDTSIKENNSIKELEYFVGSEPGVGKGIKVSITKSDTVDKTFDFNTDALPKGYNMVYVRYKTELGHWSPFLLKDFYIKEKNDSITIVQYDYIIDSNLLSSSVIKTRYNPGVDSLNFVKILTLDSNLRYGDHYYKNWIKQSDKLYTHWIQDTFTVIDCPMLDTANIKIPNKYCLNDSLLFQQDITKFGIWPKDSFNFKWYFGNSNSPISTTDILKIKATTSGKFLLKFNFAKKSDPRCKGEWKDSIIIYKSTIDTTNFRICANDSIRIHGKFKKTQGYYKNTFASIHGCDSVSVVYLKVISSFKDSFKYRVCFGDTVSVYGVKRFKSGRYDTLYRSSAGCDSSVSTLIQVSPKFNKIDSFVICQGDTINLHSKKYTQSGSYRDSFKTIYGCDSVFLTVIKVNQVKKDSFNQTICANSNSLIHGKFRNISGIYRDTFSTYLGCDSFSTVRLFVKPVYKDSFNFEICSGDSMKIHGVYRKITGQYDSLFKTVGFCDSSVFVNLKVNPRYFKTSNFTICKGDTLKVHGKNYTQNGIFTDKFITIKGCDSVFVTQLIVNPTYKDTLFVNKCSGDSFVFINDVLYVSGIYNKYLTSKKGCDSTVTVVLKIESFISASIAKKVCEGDSLKIGGIYRKKSGIYIDTMRAMRGCDSFVYVNLSFYKKDTTYISETLCFGANISFNGQTIFNAGTYQKLLSGYRGCDSLIVLKVKKRVENKVNISGSVCFGEGRFVGKSIKYGTALFTDTLINADVNGCDSIIVYNQTERKKDSVFIKTTICDGDSVFSGNGFKTKAGFYKDKLTNRYGCDSMVSTQLIVLNKNKTQLFDTMCFAGTYSFKGRTLSAPGVYFHTLKNKNGCDSLLELNLFQRKQFKPSVISLSFAVLSTDTTYKTYQWFNNRNSIPNETNRIITINKNGTYDVRVSNNLGCFANSWDDILGVSPLEKTTILIYPNPANEMLNIETNNYFDFKVFDMYGKLVLSDNKIDSKIIIDLNDLASGTYIVQVKNNNSFYQQKIVIIHP